MLCARYLSAARSTAIASALAHPNPLGPPRPQEWVSNAVGLAHYHLSEKRLEPAARLLCEIADMQKEVRTRRR